MRRRRGALPRSIVLPPALRRHRATIAVAFVTLSLLLGERALRGPAGGSDLSRYHDRSFRVLKVVDGDTVDLDEPDAGKPFTRVRLWGVDSPELTGENGPMHFAGEAKAFAEQSLLDRRVYIVLAPQDTRDRYGRLLAFVQAERGATMFNELLVEQGFAYADPRFDHPYKDRFMALEKRARGEGAGLWATVMPKNMPPWRQRHERRLTQSSTP